MTDQHKIAASPFSTLARVSSVIEGFEAGRNANGDMVRNVAASLFYAVRQDLTAQSSEISKLKGGILRLLAAIKSNVLAKEGPHTVELQDGTVHSGPVVEFLHNLVEVQIAALEALVGEAE